MPPFFDEYPSRTGNDAKIIERRDPVVYSSANDRAPLTSAQVESYAEQGFIVLRDLFDEGELSAMIEELDRLRFKKEMKDQESVILEPSDNAVRSIFAVHRVSPLFARLAQNARLVDIARFILDDEVYLHQTRVNYKPGLHGKEFFWHSDFETWHAEDGMPRMRALSVSISLTDTDEHNGPLMLIPGSHRQFVSCSGRTPDEHYRHSLRKQEHGVPGPDNLAQLVSDGGIESIRGPAGTVVFFDCNLMHGSNSNITPRPRSNVFLVYNSISNAVRGPFAAPKPRPEFLGERTALEAIIPKSGRITVRSES